MRAVPTSLDRDTVREIERHYEHAKEKHPYFCDRLLPSWPEDALRVRVRDVLFSSRSRVKRGSIDHNLMWNEILDCEVWEATEAMLDNRTEGAVYELYNCIAVLLRAIDVLRGRQELGRHKEVEQ